MLDHSWINKLEPLILQHWEENGARGLAHKPDIERFKEFENQDRFLFLGAFDGDKPVGYVAVIFHSILHNADNVFAACDAIFVKPEYRNGLLPGRLIKMAESVAKEAGADIFTYGCKPGDDFIDVLLRRGYQPAEVIMSRGLQ